MICLICQKLSHKGISLSNGNIIHKDCFEYLIKNIDDCTTNINKENLNLIAINRKISNKNSISSKLTEFFLGSKNLNDEDAEFKLIQEKIVNLQKNLNNMELKSKLICDLMLDYPPDWKNRVETVKSRDHNCVKCGATYGLHVHHMKRLSDGGSNKIENLQLLCYKCHNKEHGGRDFSKSKDSPPAISDRILTINNAILSQRKVEFLYKKVNDTNFQKRVVTPTRIIGYDHNNKEDSTLCLEGFCHTRNEDRVFALKRMRNVKISTGN